MRNGKKHVKKLAVCLLAAALLAGCCGCGTGEKRSEAESLPEQTGSLVLYVDPYIEDYFDLAVRLFSQQYPEVDVQVRNFGDFSDSQNVQNYVDALKSDLQAGAGPDLVLFLQDGYGSYEFDDLSKTAMSGAFQDLSGYFDGDTEFSFDDYNAAVMDTGVYDGQRLFVPLAYSTNVLLTTKEALSSVNMTLPKTPEEFYQQMALYGKTYREDAGKAFTDYLNQFPNFLWASGISLVDYVTKEVNVGSDDFRGLMDGYKELYEMDYVRSENNPYSWDTNTYGGAAQAVLDGKILYNYSSFHFMFLQNGSWLQYEQTPVFTAVPTADGKTAAMVSAGAAVNKNGANKANAYYFLKILLSEKMQNYGLEIQVSQFFQDPVMNGILEKWLLIKNTRMNGTPSEDEPGGKALSTDDVTAYVNLVTDVTCTHISATVRGFVWEEMEPYFKGQKTYDDCLASLKNKLELYVNE